MNLGDRGEREILAAVPLQRELHTFGGASEEQAIKLAQQVQKRFSALFELRVDPALLEQGVDPDARCW